MTDANPRLHDRRSRSSGTGPRVGFSTVRMAHLAFGIILGTEQRQCIRARILGTRPRHTEDIERADDGADAALEIESVHGTRTILRFRVAALPETVDGGRRPRRAARHGRHGGPRPVEGSSHRSRTRSGKRTRASQRMSPSASAPQRQHGARGLPDHLLRRRSEEHHVDRVASSHAHHDQIRVRRSRRRSGSADRPSRTRALARACTSSARRLVSAPRADASSPLPTVGGTQTSRARVWRTLRPTATRRRAGA